ncbi:hypothetical protein [Mucilaginibacter myungsuensis]|nr:hypothetical protein [Mucilaginibacter myungsuensis]MDN3599502.1 hypothetical protein [Mucilaginibacter myungsuensis]
MRVDPKSKTFTLSGKPILPKNYKEIAGVVLVFVGVFYFFIKVVF